MNRSLVRRYLRLRRTETNRREEASNQRCREGARQAPGGLAAALCLGILALSGCLREIDRPYVGDCADYPDGTYDYSDIGIGDCLAAPTDLRFYAPADDPDETALLVVNSNAYLNFSSGSVLPLPWSPLEARLDRIRATHADAADDEEVVPITLLTTEITASSSQGEPFSAFPVPNYCGKLAFDQELSIAFLSNRLSLTTDLSSDDPVYALDLLDPFDLTPFDLVDGATPVGEDADFFMAREDPYGMVLTTYGACSRYLYVVNETSHSVSVVDTERFPIGPVEGDAVGLVSRPVFDDSSPVSFGEVVGLSVTSYVPEDRWDLSVIEGTYRMWYRGEGLGDGGSIGYATSGDGLHFDPYVTSPVLSPGTEDQSPDRDGIGRVTVLRYGSSGENYVLLYEARRWDTETSAYRRRIMRALVSGTASVVTKYDVGSDDDVGNDAVLEPGRDFDTASTGSPWAFGYGSALVLWYTGEDADGRRSLARALSYDQGETFGEIQALTLNVPDDLEIEADFESRDATGFWDSSLDLFRLWFVAVREDGDCLAYAESADGLTFEIRPPAGSSDICLEISADQVLRSPTADTDGRVLRLWYVTASDEDAGTWTLHHARGFDGVTWYPLEQTVTMGGSASWEGGDPSPTVLKVTGDEVLRLSGESFGLVSSQLPLQNNIISMPGTGDTLQFGVLHGHVLGAGSSGEYRSDTEAFEDVSWDGMQIESPAYDAVEQALYYVGRGDDDGTGIGIATPADPDGLSWTNAANPLEGLEASVRDPYVTRYQGTVYLYYAENSDDSTDRIRMVSREDSGTTWTASDTWSFPIPEASLGASAPCVLPPGGGDSLWNMWFTLQGPETSQVGHATSDDGVRWTVDDEPALMTGTGGTWDDASVESPSVVRGDDGLYRMWYAGSNGTSYRIGLATAQPNQTQGETKRIWTWERLTDASNGDTVPVLSLELDWWDGNGVLHPDVFHDDTRERYVMWYEGRSATERRIGRAESRDGVHWTRVFAPFSAGDRFTFQTTSLSSTEDGDDGPSSIINGAISLRFTLSGTYFSGIGATEIGVAPDCSIAVVGARYTPGVYILDIRDDSTDTMFDANYHGVEAVVTLDNNAYDVASAGNQPGARAIVFSPSGDRFYMTSAQPDSVLVFDRTQIPDRSAAHVIREGVLLGAIELERGLVEDKGGETSADVGPTALALSGDGRYLWVANGNANNVYAIDLALGTLGDVVAIARDVGEEPVALALSSDERYLLVANFVGELEEIAHRQRVAHSSMSVIDADRSSPTFGRMLAVIKNLELEQ